MKNRLKPLVVAIVFAVAAVAFFGDKVSYRESFGIICLITAYRLIEVFLHAKENKNTDA